MFIWSVAEASCKMSSRGNAKRKQTSIVWGDSFFLLIFLKVPKLFLFWLQIWIFCQLSEYFNNENYLFKINTVSSSKPVTNTNMKSLQTSHTQIQHDTYSSETSQAEPTSDPGDQKTRDNPLQQRVRLHEKHTILPTSTSTITILRWQQPEQPLQQPLLLLLHTILPTPRPSTTTTTTTTTVGSDCRLLPGKPVLLATGQQTNQFLLLIKREKKN